MNKYPYLQSLIEAEEYPANKKKILAAGKKAGAKVVPDRMNFKAPTVTLRKGDIGLEIEWDEDNAGWLQLSWEGKRNPKKPKTGSSGTDNLDTLLRRIIPGFF